MRKVVVGTTLGLLVLVVIVIVGVNIAYHSGRLTPCMAAAERSVRSPHDGSVVTIAMASCGESRQQISVQLASAGKVYQLLLAYSAATDPPVAIAWRAANHIELRYPDALQIEFGPVDATRSFFGDIEVTYEAELRP